MYLVDANVVIHGFDFYPPDVFPKYWESFDAFVAQGEFKFHEKVCEELEERDDEKSEWLRALVPKNERLSPESDEIDSYRRLTEWVRFSSSPAYKIHAVHQFLNVADSWIVACAAAHNLTIITNEKPGPMKSEKVKIPEAAEALNVKWVSGLEFLRSKNIKF